MSIAKKKQYLFVALIYISVLAWATTYGPFSVKNFPQYATTDFATDQTEAFLAAEYIAQKELSTVLTNPTAIAKAIKSDSVRIVYADGTIADFKIKLWPSSYPVLFTQTVSSANQKLVYTQENGCNANSGSYTLNTGYWGSEANASDSTVTITAVWIDTGNVTIFNGNPRPMCA